jgi:hypothetical protein
MRVRQRRFDVVRHVLVELVVLRLGDLRLGPRPERGRLIDLFVLVGHDLFACRAVPLLLLHDNGERDVVRVLVEDRAKRRARQQPFFALAEVEDDVGAARVLAGRFDAVIAFAGALPSHAVPGLKARAAREERHPVGDDERGVEADAKLADQLGILGAIGREGFEELAGAGLRDRADVLDDVLARHADAVVRDRDRAGLLVVTDANLQVRVVSDERAVGNGIEPQLVAGVRRIGHEFPQEDLLVAVQGVNHQVEELFDLGLEAERFSGRCFVHVSVL